MRFVTTPQATILTGLSTVTLREWTSRRALIPADKPPRSKGSPASFTWQTILLLRVAATLRNRFHLELQPHRTLFASLKAGLRRTSFIALWDKTLVLQGGDQWSLVEAGETLPLIDDAILIVLQPHLAALSLDFALPLPRIPAGQLELFPARPVDSTTTPLVGPSARKGNPDTVLLARGRSA